MTAIATNISSRRVVVAGLQIACDEAGSGPALLVLHHEIGSPGWMQFYDELSVVRRVLVPDLPGYGRSGRPDWARSPRDLAVLMHLFLDKTGIGDVDVVGLGFGGWIAAEMATMNQGRFRSLVLVNPYGLKPREGEILDQFLISHEDFVRRGFSDARNFESVFTAEPPLDTLEAWDIHREMTTRIAWKPYMYSPALPALLPEVRVPTLVAAGVDDVIAPTECAREYASLLPKAELHMVACAGHLADLEQPAELAASIVTFLNA